jgi:hypothetical protein
MALALTLVVAVAAVAGTAIAGPSAVKSVLTR